MATTYLASSDDFTTVANAIRTKGGTTAALSFPNGMTQAIADIQTQDYTVEDGLLDGAISGDYTNKRVRILREYAFYRCTGLKNVTLQNVTSVPGYAFASYSSTSGYMALTSVSCPNATSVDYYAFRYATKLSSVNLPKAASIGNNAFAYCQALTTLSLNAASVINSYVFTNCTALKTLYLPSVTIIGTSAFYRCSALTDLYLANQNAVCVYNTSSASYDPSNANLKIHVPAALLGQYKAATNWSRLASKFVGDL